MEIERAVTLRRVGGERSVRGCLGSWHAWLLDTGVCSRCDHLLTRTLALHVLPSTDLLCRLRVFI